jgi:hypothetical protein
MPSIIQGNLTLSPSYETNSFGGKDLGYKYPYDLNIKPGSKLHSKILSEVLNRARESSNLISNRIESWNKIERVMTTYIDLSSDEDEIKSNDPRKPVSIIFPYTYVIVETMLTYLTSVFLVDPIMRYKGVSDEDTLGAIMLEKVVQNQCNYFKVSLALHTFLRDCIVYGIGVAAPVWEKKTGIVIREDRSGFASFFRGHGTRIFEEEIVYEGNKLENVDPYLYLPNPRVPVHKIQDAEYIGWIHPTSRIALLRDEKVSEDLFNVKYLKDVQLKKSSIYNKYSSERSKKVGLDNYESLDSTITNPVDVVYLYIDLIPKDWELGDSEYPEKWLFGVANDEIVIKAKKLGLAHGMYPIITAAPDFDGYSVLPISRPEILYGLQGVLDFLFNSHIANVRKAINDTLVVDPYLININDLKDPEPGKIIRMRRPAWGKGVKDAVQQLKVEDITRANIADTSIIVQWMQKVSGADESMMGALRSGGPERLTGQEFQGTRAGAVERLERIARVISLQGMRDLGYMFASHTQQLMTQDVYVDTIGRQQEVLTQIYNEKSQMKVTPWDLLINFDVEIKDGSIPNGSDKSWIRLFEILAKNPELGKNFNMPKIFEHIAQIMGAKNVQDFKIIPKVMSDEDVERGIQSGNLAPMGTNSP